MYIPKKYGQSKAQNCPFCGKQATAQNTQGVPVCRQHKDSQIKEMTCLCGSTLEQKAGKWGPYFTCYKCGNINMKKVMEFNEGDAKVKINGALKTKPSTISSAPSVNYSSVTSSSAYSAEEPAHNISRQKPRKEIEVRSDDPTYFD